MGLPFRPAFLAAVASALAAGCGSTTAPRADVALQPAPASRPPQRIAVVDFQRAVLESREGRAAQAALRKMFDARQAELDRRRTELQDLKEEIEAQAPKLTADVRNKRVEDWQRRSTELQAVYVEFQKELEKRQRDLSAPIMHKVVRVAGELAEKRGYGFVFDKQAAPYARAEFDLTEEAIKACDAE